MKDSLDSAIVSRGSDAEVFANRRLIRPSLSRSENHRPENGDRRERGGDRPDRGANAKKAARKISIIRSKCSPKHRWCWCCRTMKKSTA